MGNHKTILTAGIIIPPLDRLKTGATVDPSKALRAKAITLLSHPPSIMYSIGIKRVCQQVHPGCMISKNALNTVNTIMTITGKNISLKAKEMYQKQGKHTLTSREIQFAMETVLPGELAKHAKSEGTKAVTKYTSDVSTTKRTRKEKRANLSFSVSRTRTLLGADHKRIGETAPIYLCAVLEYLCAEFLELAGNVARDLGKKVIQNRHILLTIKNDEEIKGLIDRQSIALTSSIEHEKSVIPKKVSTDTPKEKQHRWKPGTVAARKVKKLQKTDGLLLQKAPFKRMLRRIAEELSSNTKFAKGFSSNFQASIENQMVRLFSLANTLTKHARRKTVEPTDVQLAFNILYEGRFSGFYGSFDGDKICNNSIGRLASKGGVLRRSRAAVDDVRGFIINMSSSIMKHIVGHTSYRRGVIITLEDCTAGFKDAGILINTNN